jgi:antitoxin component YwqK of YwqJK toxin-antitoxin module
MKTRITLLGIALLAATLVSAQQGELVIVDPETNKEFYTRNDYYQVDESGAYSGLIASYHENGSIEESGELEKGVKVGTWVKYDDAGNKVGEIQYRNGLKHGVWRVWSSDGSLRVKLMYDRGKRVGTWQFFDEEGNLIKEKSYE